MTFEQPSPWKRGGGHKLEPRATRGRTGLTPWARSALAHHRIGIDRLRERVPDGAVLYGWAAGSAGPYTFELAWEGRSRQTTVYETTLENVPNIIDLLLGVDRRP